MTLWGDGTPLREFLWSEDMADASVYLLLNVDFKDIIGIEKYSSVFYGSRTDGAVDRNNSEGRGGAIPALGEIRNCHINVGTWNCIEQYVQPCRLIRLNPMMVRPCAWDFSLVRSGNRR